VGSNRSTNNIGEDGKMVVSIVLCKFTQKGVENIKDFQKSMVGAAKGGKAHGIKGLGSYFTIGQYDFVMITETDAPDEVGLQRLFALCRRGFLRTETLRAIPAEKGFEAISKLEDEIIE
jgi:uncharacterized protein with GYD domain